MGINVSGGATATGCAPGGLHRAEKWAGGGDVPSRPVIQLGSLTPASAYLSPPGCHWLPTWALGQDKHAGGQRGSRIQLPSEAVVGANLGGVQGWHPRKAPKVSKAGSVPD